MDKTMFDKAIKHIAYWEAEAIYYNAKRTQEEWAQDFYFEKLAGVKAMVGLLNLISGVSIDDIDDAVDIKAEEIIKEREEKRKANHSML